MIPVKLFLRNFMCYHDNVDALYFDNFHVACLSGDNGHGKSALLDAITWALWGKTRAKSDDDLIHMGESEMEVEFEFLVDNAKYRVIRKRSKGSLRRPKQPILELQIATSEGYIPITGNNIRETEKKIIELLRMDYDTFINSALLLQGRADEFSMKRPGERKEVIANILNLAIYDELEKTARNVVKDKEVRYREINDTIARIEKQLEQKAYFENELIAADESMKLLSAELEKQETSIKRLRGVEEALKFKAEQSIDLGRQIEKTKQQLYFFEKTISGQKDRIQKYEAILAEYGNKILENQKKLNEIVDLEKDLTAKRKTIEELSNRTHHLNSANTRLKDEMKELKSKLDMLDQDKVECPLCGTELGKEGKERILSNYRNQGNEKGEAYRINQKEIQEKRQELENLRREVGKFESSLISERTQIERRIATLDKDRSEAEFNLPKEKESVVQAQAAIESLHKSMTDDSSKCDTLTIEVKDLQKIKNELGSIERVYKELREKERISQGRIAELKANLNRCVQLAIEKSENSKVLHLLIEEKEIYEELAVAFGKKGVQALIIESVLPEIEEEANKLLGRMTDNRMHLKIESQRDTKKGDTIETLEIRISDELGTRSYEMFSGGEAFRVNFALRIALSKLLARRAGAPLPTIIIDEGFGTQDNTGKEKLIEAINSIKDDFKKILVITHIEELKDAFPVRIEVTKTEYGSVFVLN